MSRQSREGSSGDISFGQDVVSFDMIQGDFLGVQATAVNVVHLSNGNLSGVSGEASLIGKVSGSIVPTDIGYDVTVSISLGGLVNGSVTASVAVSYETGLSLEAVEGGITRGGLDVGVGYVYGGVGFGYSVTGDITPNGFQLGEAAVLGSATYSKMYDLSFDPNDIPSGTVDDLNRDSPSDNPSIPSPVANDDGSISRETTGVQNGSGGGANSTVGRGSAGQGNSTNHSVASVTGWDSRGAEDLDGPEAVVPIVIDLDADGIEITFGKEVFFDVDGDGYHEQTSWIGADDGFLVIDLNSDGTIGGDGIIDQVRELAFAQWHQDYAAFLNDGDDATRITDLQALAEAVDEHGNLIFDSDGSGVFDSGDDLWESFYIWQDVNQNGVSDPGELIALSDVVVTIIDEDEGEIQETGIHSINLTYDDGSGFAGTDDDISVFGNTLYGLGSFEVGDSTVVGGVGDIALAYNSLGYREQVDLVTGITTIEFEAGGELRYADMTSSTALDIDLSAENLDGVTGNASDNILDARGRLSAVSVSGGNGDDTLYGSEVDDLLSGDEGADILIGGNGNDTFFIDADDATISGGSGYDTVIVADDTTGVELDLSASNIEAAFGGGLDDSLDATDARDDVQISGNGGDDTLSGGFGNDIVSGGAGDDIIDGNDGSDRLFGGEGQDILDGSSGDDFLVGGSGGDVIDAGSGSDDVYGGAGDDIITGGTGSDFLSGGAGNDTFYGGTGDDEHYGGEGDDTFYDISGDNHFEGNEGDDSFYVSASSGNAAIYGGLGNDTVYLDTALSTWTIHRVGIAQYRLVNGDEIIDMVDVENIVFSDADTSQADVLAMFEQSHEFDVTATNEDLFLKNIRDAGYLHSGIYLIVHPDHDPGAAVDQTIISYGWHERSGDDTGDWYLVTSYTGDDEFNTASGNDVVNAGNGDDIVNGGAGADWINGELGNDTINASSGDDVVYGGAGEDVISAGSGDDQVSGGDDADIISGGSGDDLLYGGAGDDELTGSSGQDVLSGNEGDDHLEGGTGADRLWGGEGDDFLDGGIGRDVLSGDVGNDRLYGREGDDEIYGGAGDDFLSGAWGADRLYGGDDNDELRGYSDNDLLYGGSGADLLLGGSGNDILEGGSGADTIDGESGMIDFAGYQASEEGVQVDLLVATAAGGDAEGDTLLNIEGLIGSEHDDTLTGNDAGNILYGGDGVDVIRGHDGNDQIYGDAGDDDLYDGLGDDVVYGGAGDDYIRAGGGEDRYYGGAGSDYISYYESSNGVTLDLALNTASGSWAGNDVIFEFENATGSATGDDILIGSAEDNRLRGYGGDDEINGRGGSDMLDGGSGNDRLDGGNGSDILTGGAGADTFHFDHSEDADVITDFENNIDVIELDNFEYSTLSEAFDAASQIGDDVVFDFGDGDTLTVQNITIAQLQNDVVLV